MTSILYQYEQASQLPKSANNNIITPPATSGYVSVQLEEDVPIFSKQRMNFSPSDNITHMAVANDRLILAMANNKLFRIDLQRPDQHEEITLSKYIQPNARLVGLFLDPLGTHLLLSYASKFADGYPELFYLHKKSSKLKIVPKSRNYEVTEVGWNFDNAQEHTTGPILLGTSKGLILEIEVGPDSDKVFQSGIEQYWKQVFDIGKGSQKPITGIEFHREPNTNKYYVFVTTSERLYQFVGHTNSFEKPLLQPIFNTYLNIPDCSYQEIPSTLNYSRLQFFYHSKGVPKTFAWMTGAGLFHGQIDPKSQENSNSIYSDGKLLPYPPLRIKLDPKAKVDPAPLSFVLTEFHAILLYNDHIKSVSLLNDELVHEDYYPETYGKLLKIVKDPAKNIIWSVTEKFVFRHRVTKEERFVWQIYCEKNEFDLAKQYCQDNPAHIDKVNVKQAEILYNKGDYDKSAEIYSETQSSFEEICLKFLQSNKIDALRLYLRKKLEKLPVQDTTQITLIVIWIVELFLSQLSSLRRKNTELSNPYKDLQREFEMFLSFEKVRDCIKTNKSVIYDLMASHGDKQNLIKLTIMNKDFEDVIRQNIYKKSYIEALEVLKAQGQSELFYQFCPVLMQKVPKHTVNALIAQGKNVKPVHILPALVTCGTDETHATEIIRYLEFCIEHYRCDEKAIHNYLLSLYAEYNKDALMRYLARQGQELANINFDVHYALRLCREHQLTEACVKLSALLGLWESAVELALTVDLNLAKKTANLPDEDQHLKKKLWLKIAQNVISQDEDVKKAMKFLEECDLIKIEDILPFFTNVVNIDHFREPICTSLQEYNQQIEDLKGDIEEATKAAELVRNEIQSFRNRSVIVSVSDVCSLCEIALLLRPFYLFPCGHRYHSDCLMQEVSQLLGPAKRNKLTSLQKQLHSEILSDSTSTNSNGLSMREQVKIDIDDIIASECYYCGEYMIQSIDTPFIPDSDWDRVMKEWE